MLLIFGISVSTDAVSLSRLVERLEVENINTLFVRQSVSGLEVGTGIILEERVLRILNHSGSRTSELSSRGRIECGHFEEGLTQSSIPQTPVL